MAAIGGRGPLTPLGVYLTGPGRSVFPEAFNLGLRLWRWKGEEDLPSCSLTHSLREQLLIIFVDGFLRTLDSRLGSEADGEGIEELSSPAGQEETEQALKAWEELHMQCSGRLPVGAGLCQGPGRVKVTLKSTVCQHS